MSASVSNVRFCVCAGIVGICFDTQYRSCEKQLRTVPGAPSLRVSAARRTTRPSRARPGCETLPLPAGTNQRRTNSLASKLHHGVAVHSSTYNCLHTTFVTQPTAARALAETPSSTPPAPAALATQHCQEDAAALHACSPLDTIRTRLLSQGDVEPPVCHMSYHTRTVVQHPRARRAIFPSSATRRRVPRVARHRHPPPVPRPHRRARGIHRHQPRQHTQQQLCTVRQPC